MITDKEPVKAIYANKKVVLSDPVASIELHNQSSWGSLEEDNRLSLSMVEALYLFEKNKITIYQQDKALSKEQLLEIGREIDPNFYVRYQVFKDIRNRGYVCKTALKFGADFRVYDRGIKPGEDHAKWIVYPVHESEQLTWYDFAAKNRVAHSTKKRLMIGIVDDEGDVTYYEVKWARP